MTNLELMQTLDKISMEFAMRDWPEMVVDIDRIAGDVMDSMDPEQRNEVVDAYVIGRSEE